MAQTGKFRKTKSLFATTLVTGIGTGTGDTITLNSATGLPTDTEITLTFNRVDSNGAVQPTSDIERITGTIVGSALTSYTRGIDGTTEQAHLASTVVEYIWNADDWNDAVDGVLVEHNQDGTHKTATVTTLKATSAEITTGTVDTKLITPKGLADAGITVAPVKATGAEVTTGTDDAKFATPKALADAGVNTRLKSKVITATRDAAAASGNVAYTGVGFTPTSMHVQSCIDNTLFWGWGFAASDLSGGAFANTSATSSSLINQTAAANVCAGAIVSAGNSQIANVISWDADGFTLGWVKAGSPTGTIRLNFICYR